MQLDQTILLAIGAGISIGFTAMGGAVGVLWSIVVSNHNDTKKKLAETETKLAEAERKLAIAETQSIECARDRDRLWEALSDRTGVPVETLKNSHKLT